MSTAVRDLRNSPSADPWRQRVDAGDWDAITAEIDEYGGALLPQLLDRLGSIGFGLILSGALLYTLGALVYARHRPDPRPTVFGYHEVFHLLVIAAAAAHYAAVAGFVLPRL